MQHGGGTFRTLVTLLVAVALPLCCCDFHSLFGGCSACDSDAEHVATSTHGDDSDDPAEQCPVAEHRGGSHHEQCPAQPGHHGNDKQGCTCGKNQGGMVSVEKPTLELSKPLLVAVLPWTLAPEVVSVVPSTAYQRVVWPCARPPTSLLRQHCALTV